MYLLLLFSILLFHSALVASLGTVLLLFVRKTIILGISNCVKATLRQQALRQPSCASG
jgi:hypothetical protein